MPEIINLEDEFNSWFNEIEMYCLRSERFYEELPSMTSHKMIDWLKAAYMHGIKTAAQDSVDTLRDYLVTLEGCIDYDLYPSHAVESLYVYWTGVLRDKK